MRCCVREQKEFAWLDGRHRLPHANDGGEAAVRALGIKFVIEPFDLIKRDSQGSFRQRKHLAGTYVDTTSIIDLAGLQRAPVHHSVRPAIGDDPFPINGVVTAWRLAEADRDGPQRGGYDQSLAGIEPDPCWRLRVALVLMSNEDDVVHNLVEYQRLATFGA